MKLYNGEENHIRSRKKMQRKETGMLGVFAGVENFWVLPRTVCIAWRRLNYSRAPA